VSDAAKTTREIAKASARGYAFVMTTEAKALHSTFEGDEGSGLLPSRVNLPLL
jgi:hypothetical protein